MTIKTLRWLLIVVLLAVQGAAAIVVLLGAKDKAAAHLTEDAHKSLDRLAGSVVEHADSFLAPALARLKVGHRLVADGMLDPSSVRHLENYLLAELQANPMISGLYVGRADGSFMMTTRNREGVLTALIESFGGLRSVLMTQRDQELSYLRTWVDPQNSFDPRKRPWYFAARESTGIAIAPAYRFFQSGIAGVTGAIQLQYPDGSDAGVLGVDISLEALSTFIARSLVSANSSAVILDQDDQVVVSSNPGHIAASSPEAPMPSLASIPDEGLQLLSRRTAIVGESGDRPNSAVPGVRGGAAIVESFMVNQQPTVGLAQRIPLAGGLLDWTLLAQLPVIEHNAEFPGMFDDKLKMIVAIFAITTLIALLGSFGLGSPALRAESHAGLDPLTGALTRSEFERRMQGMLGSRRQTETESRVYLVALDLDGFKALNDEYGESVGDFVLSRFVARLTKKIRDSDLIGRNGGDEFVFALRLDRDVDVLATVERIHHEVVHDGFRSKAGLHVLGFTAGIACFDADESLDSLISRANQALVTGKARGRNRCYMAPDHHARWPETVVSAISAQETQRQRGTTEHDRA